MAMPNVTFEREYSDLGAMQKPHRLVYALDAAQEACRYSLCISSYAANDLEEDCQACFYSEKSVAENVLLLLYENSVDPRILKDVLENLQTQGIIAL